MSCSTLTYLRFPFTMGSMATEPAIGTSIKRARERKRWTQRQLAGALEVDRKTIDNWEHDRSYPRSSIGALEEVLGISLDLEPAPVRLNPEIMGLANKIREQLDELPPDARDEVTRAVASVLGVDQDG